jgi:glycosyltransferase involved in cell wall biosynthesis
MYVERPPMAAVPKVSVIVPCFNLGQYLDEAVDSVLAQTCQDFEILIVDDGSTDPDTRRILDGYARPKTTVFRTPNCGLAAARNFLLARAQGEYLCALDADDKLHPRFLETTLAVLERDPSFAFVSSRLQMFGDENRTWPDEDRCDLAALLCDDTVITAALVRRQAVLAVGGYDEQMPHPGNEDWDLWISLVEAGYTGVILPEILFFYRRRPGSMCVQCTTGQTRLDLMEYLVRKHAKSYGAHLLDVLLWKEGHISNLRRINVQLEAELAAYLAPTVTRRRAELQELRAKLQQARRDEAEHDRSQRFTALDDQLAQLSAEFGALRAEYRRCLAEVAALRASASWRITSPLRSVYDVLRRLRGGIP